MKRGRKTQAELAALAKRPADLRQPWQIEQAARCGCRGSDDLCPCQNVTPWPAPVIDWKARAETAEASLSVARGERDEAVKLLVHCDDWWNGICGPQPWDNVSAFLARLSPSCEPAPVEVGEP